MRVVVPRRPQGEPTVSVVVPCYRYGSFLPQVVASTLAQPGVQVEVIIVDDASPDDSALVAQALAAADPRVTVVQHEVNRGHIRTYNDGIAAATGDYLVLLSADDLLAPGALARATALMEHDPSVTFVYGYSPDFSDEPPAPRRSLYSWSVWSGDDWVRRLCVRGSNVVSNPEVVMRRSVMVELGEYDPRFPHTADLLLWLRAAARGSVGRVNGPDQGYYRVHGNNMHLTEFSSVHTDLVERARTFDALLEEDLAEHPRRARLRALAHRALAVDAVRWATWTLDNTTDEAGARAFGETAPTLWPAITSTRLWAAYERRLRAEGPRRFDRTRFGLDWEVRHKLRWRRWRRLGT